MTPFPIASTSCPEALDLDHSVAADHGPPDFHRAVTTLRAYPVLLLRAVRAGSVSPVADVGVERGEFALLVGFPELVHHLRLTDDGPYSHESVVRQAVHNALGMYYLQSGSNVCRSVWADCLVYSLRTHARVHSVEFEHWLSFLHRLLTA